MRFDLAEGFPLLTTKFVPFRLIVSELIWFIQGDTNIRYLLKHNNNIWNEWAFKKNGWKVMNIQVQIWTISVTVLMRILLLRSFI